MDVRSGRVSRVSVCQNRNQAGVKRHATCNIDKRQQKRLRGKHMWGAGGRMAGAAAWDGTTMNVLRAHSTSLARRLHARTGAALRRTTLRLLSNDTRSRGSDGSGSHRDPLYSQSPSFSSSAVRAEHRRTPQKGSRMPGRTRPRRGILSPSPQARSSSSSSNTEGSLPRRRSSWTSTGMRLSG